MAASISQRVQKRRDALRGAGLRPLQIWVPDTGARGFAEECRRQALIVAQLDLADPDLLDFLDAGLADLGETDG